MFVLDTNTLIYFFKGKGQVAKRLLNRPRGEIAIPAIVLYELQVGIAKSNSPNKRQQQLNALLGNIHLLAFDAEAASRSALLRAALEVQGTRIGPVDTLIAGTALAVGGTLVTRNTREFSRVEGLRVIDWY